MSASTGFARQVDDLGRLLALASLRKEDIAASGEETRRQMQLTLAEEGRIAEAKSYLAKADELKSELKGREDTLADSKIKHELGVKQYTAYVASENVRLESFSARLEVQKHQLEEVSKQQLIEADRLRGLGIDMSRQHQDAMSSVQKQEAQNNADRQSNAA